MKHIKIFENYNEDDQNLTDFRKNAFGYGDDFKDNYSYSNEDDVDEIFNIIENDLFMLFVSQKMKSYDNIIDDKLNDTIDKHINFVKSINGLSFENGAFNLAEGLTKEEVVKAYIKSGL